jgi:hypothetical protein
MLLADLNPPMGITLGLVNQTAKTNPTNHADYTIFTLRQLLIARQALDANGYADRERRLEEEIQKRCLPLQASTQRKGSVVAGSARRYRLYGLMAGVFCLVVSSGPFLAVEFLDAMNFSADVNGDNALLSGVWAVLTLPFAVMVFMIGAFMDAERVVKWLKL